MPKNHSISYSLQRITQRIVTGLFLIFPFTATVVVLLWIIGGSDNLVRAILRFVGLPDTITWNPIISVFFALFILYLIGSLSTFLFIRRLISIGEGLVRRIPVVNFIYNTTKQIIEAISLQSRQSFKKVVIVEYPRKGIYALAFMTGQTPREDCDQEPFINVFLPTTPNPTSGFFLLLPRTDVRDTNLTIEEGVKMIISGGILTPKPLGMSVITKQELEEMSITDEWGSCDSGVMEPAVQDVSGTPAPPVAVSDEAKEKPPSS